MSRCRPADAELAEAAPQRAGIEAQHRRRAKRTFDAPALGIEHAHDVVALDVRKTEAPRSFVIAGAVDIGGVQGTREL